jgi:hypothetical protein
MQNGNTSNTTVPVAEMVKLFKKRTGNFSSFRPGFFFSEAVPLGNKVKRGEERNSQISRAKLVSFGGLLHICAIL